MSDPTKLFVVTATVDSAELKVLSCSVFVGLSAMSWAECELTDDASGPDPANVIGKRLVLTARREEGGSQLTFVGDVVEAELYGEETPNATLRVRVAPRLWRLGKRSGYRVFQDMSVVDIVKDVLTRAGMPEAEQDWTLSDSYQPRSYCLQHRESELDFIERLLSEEGIAYAVEAKDGVDTVRFTDRDFGSVDGAAELVFRQDFGFHEGSDAVWDIEQLEQRRSDVATIRGYDFEKPDLNLEKQATRDGSGALGVYSWPARTTDEAELEHHATVLLESIACDRHQIAGSSGALHLSPGRRFSISDHPYAAINQELRVLNVTFRYGAARWAAGETRDAQGLLFEAMPGAIPYRPPRLRRYDDVPGYDTAVVVGPSGAELDADEHGRTRAQFHWDREGKGDDSASIYMRGAQPQLGAGLLTPRVGFEVALRRVDGDPDHALVSTRLYNAEWPPPYALPEHKTRMTIQTSTTPGGGSVNEIRFDDKKGAEEMFINGSKNSSVSAGNNCTETVGANETRTIGANQKLEVSGSQEAIVGASQSVSVGANQKVGVSTFLVEEMSGSHVQSIGGSRNITVGGDHRKSMSANSELAVSGTHIDLIAGSVSDATLTSMTHNVGAAYVELTASDRSIAVEGARSETVGAVKAVVCSGGRGTKSASLTHKIAGAMLVKTTAAINENASGTFADVAGGAQITKATEVTFAAKSLLTIVCGGSTVTITPGSVSVAGASIKIDGTAPELAVLVKDN